MKFRGNRALALGKRGACRLLPMSQTVLIETDPWVFCGPSHEIQSLKAQGVTGEEIEDHR